MKIFCEGGWNQVEDLMHGAFRNKAVFTYNADNADLIVFSGGADISPELYGDAPLEVTSTSPRRDDLCVYLWNIAKKNNAKTIGICRGAQFQSAMLGGKLWQHIISHHDHTVEGGMRINSYHHQGIMPHDGIDVIHTGKAVWGFSAAGDEQDITLVESFISKDKMHFGVQWHPEFIYPNKTECVQWFINKCREFMS